LRHPQRVRVFLHAVRRSCDDYVFKFCFKYCETWSVDHVFRLTISTLSDDFIFRTGSALLTY